MLLLRKIFLPLVILLTIILTYWDLPKTFFQQDEWWGFGGYLYYEGSGGLMSVLANFVLSLSKVHFNPLTNLISYIQFKLFLLNFAPYAYSAIVNQIVNSFLVWYLFYLILKNKNLSFLIALLFGVFSISHQGVTWASANLSVQGALLFSLFSLIFFVKFIHKQNIKFVYISLFSLLIALLFKETAFSLFLFFPFLFFLLKGKKKINLKSFAPLFIFGILYVIMRLIFIKIAPPLIVGQNQLIEGPSINTLIFRILEVPFRIIPQTIFPQLQIISWSNNLVNFAYPQYVLSDGFPNPYISQTIVFDLACYIFSALILVLLIFSWFIFKKYKNYNLQKGILFGIVFIIISGIPLLLIPGKAGFNPIFEPRHLYLSNVGSSALIVLFLYSLSILLVRSEKKTIILTIVFLVPIFVLNIGNIRSDIVKLEKMGSLRKYFLKEISSKYPNPSEKMIIYTESDTAYYGLPENEKILPVQIGFGRMIGIWYAVDGKLPSCFFKDQNFYDILKEDYIFCQGRGFGYFRNYDRLLTSVKSNKISPENVIGFSWEGKTEKFKDITADLRKKIERDFVKN